MASVASAHVRSITCTGGLLKNEATVQLNIELPSAVFQALKQAAMQNKHSVEQLAADCVSQSFETTLRHRVLIERQEEIDKALLTIAEFVGTLMDPSGVPLVRHSSVADDR